MRKYSLLTLAGAALFLSSCLKDKNIEDRVYGMGGISDVKLVEFPSSPDDVRSLDFSTNDTTFRLLAVRLNSAEPASQDIKVTLVPNNTLVTAAGYTVAPANTYTLDNLTVTIPAGKREGYLTIKTKPSDMAMGAYAFGFSIGSVSDPSVVLSENYKNILVVVTVKNKYDGVYTLRGHFLRTDNPAFTGPFTTEVELETSGATSVDMYWELAHAYAQPFANNGSLTYFGNVAPRITFNAADQVVSLFNITGAGGSPTMTLFPGYNSRYDPATKTIYLKYYYNTNPANRVFTDTLIYVGPR
jgi:hypothetical protein